MEIKITGKRIENGVYLVTFTTIPLTIGTGSENKVSKKLYNSLKIDSVYDMSVLSETP
jgi:hypothetical protein